MIKTRTATKSDDFGPPIDLWGVFNREGVTQDHWDVCGDHSEVQPCWKRSNQHVDFHEVGHVEGSSICYVKRNGAAQQVGWY